jgi:hypothetical protein
VSIYWIKTPETLAKCFDSIAYIAKEPLGPMRHLLQTLVIAFHCLGPHLRG